MSHIVTIAARVRDRAVISVEPQSLSSLPTRFGRLKMKLPGSLRRHLVPGPITGAYRLSLGRDQIHVFE